MQLGQKNFGIIVIVIVIEIKNNCDLSITFELDFNYFWISFKRVKIKFNIKIIVNLRKIDSQ